MQMLAVLHLLAWRFPLAWIALIQLPSGMLPCAQAPPVQLDVNADRPITKAHAQFALDSKEKGSTLISKGARRLLRSFLCTHRKLISATRSGLPFTCTLHGTLL